MDTKQLINLLEANSNKNFVRRILTSGISPVLVNGDGTISTHSMASAEIDGKNIVFPTVIQAPNGGLLRLSMDAALEHAIKSKEFIGFKTAEEANSFASGQYKEATMFKAR